MRKRTKIQPTHTTICPPRWQIDRACVLWSRDIPVAPGCHLQMARARLFTEKPRRHDMKDSAAVTRSGSVYIQKKPELNEATASMAAKNLFVNEKWHSWKTAHDRSLYNRENRTATQTNSSANQTVSRRGLVSKLVGALSPVNHKVL